MVVITVVLLWVDASGDSSVLVMMVVVVAVAVCMIESDGIAMTWW